MSTVNITAANFEQILQENELVILDFWAEWCGPCKSFGPIFEQASQTHTDVVFGKIDTEAEQELAGSLGIRSIPTTMVFREGVLLFNQSGVLPEAGITEVLGKARELDMDAVRKEIAEREAS